MNYKLNTNQDAAKTGLFKSLGKLWGLMATEKKNTFLALLAILVNSSSTLTGPFLIGYAINNFISHGNFTGVLIIGGILMVLYSLAGYANYLQVRLMGRVGQNVLFTLRNRIFGKLQELPVAFFNQNKAGDLISRINNDTDKLNNFFSQALVQFVGNLFIVIGAGIFLIVINWRLALAVLIPALGILILTRVISSWIKRTNLQSLQATGSMSGEIQESLDNFKVILAFNRRDYFREKFSLANINNYKKSVMAGIANGILSPVYDFASNVAQLIFLAYGLYLIMTGHLTIGFFVSFLSYINSFYNPLRQMAALWSTFQTALAAWDRISDILAMNTDMLVMPELANASGAAASSGASNKKALQFKDVSFGYPDGKTILHNISFDLEHGKTYALVGPTGGGKTTTASLMARLYDPTSGSVFLDGQDIRAYSIEERTKRIGFILQEPFLFNGTVAENILYGNILYPDYTSAQLNELLKKEGLDHFFNDFEKGLDTEIKVSSDSISLGQRQIIAFVRAMLRKPDLLILDEATANIDTVTEQLLEDILKKLPTSTTRVIIAHRLNTIENADQIFFVNSGTITPAGSMEQAVNMLLKGKRSS